MTAQFLSNQVCWLYGMQPPQERAENKRRLQKERITLEEFQEQLSQIDKSLRALPATAQVLVDLSKEWCRSFGSAVLLRASDIVTHQ